MTVCVAAHHHNLAHMDISADMSRMDISAALGYAVATVLPHPGGPLACERFVGGGSDPTAAVSREIGNAPCGVTPPCMDISTMNITGSTGFCWAASLPAHVLKAHTMALEAYSVQDARDALRVAGNAPCPQAHVRLAEVQSRSLEDALAHYERATLDAEQFISIFAPTVTLGTEVVAQGLNAKPELNGVRGKVVSYKASTSRYGVQFTGYSAPMALRLANLQYNGDASPTAAQRQASYNDDSLWLCPLARPWFRAWLGLANTKRKLGDFEGALRAYMTIVEVDGEHFVTQSSGFVQYRNYIASCLLLLGRPREARRFMLHVCRHVMEFTFVYASSNMWFNMNLALAECLVALEDGQPLEELPEYDGPLHNIRELCERPHMVFWRLCGEPDRSCDKMVINDYKALYEYLFDESYLLPDLDRVPDAIGDSSTHLHAMAYLGDGMLDLWRRSPSAIQLVRRCKNSYDAWRMCNKAQTPDVASSPQRLAALRGCLTAPAGVCLRPQYASKLVHEASWFEPWQQREEALGAVLAALGGAYPPADERGSRPIRETALNRSMYYDNLPSVVAALVRAGCVCWFSFDRDAPRERPFVDDMGNEMSPLSPCAMAVEQGSWRALAVALHLSPSLCTQATLSDLAEGLWHSGCVYCVAGVDRPCGRCGTRLPAPGDAPNNAHSPHASFEMIAEVLVHFGLRTMPEPVEGVVAAACQRPPNPRATPIARIFEHFRVRMSGGTPPARCVCCNRKPRGRLVELIPCSGCRLAFYCSDRCRRRHVPLHTEVCGVAALQRKEEAIREVLPEAGLIEHAVAQRTSSVEARDECEPCEVPCEDPDEARLDTLLAMAWSRGMMSETAYDRLTDALAAGVWTVRQLADLWDASLKWRAAHPSELPLDADALLSLLLWIGWDDRLAFSLTCKQFNEARQIQGGALSTLGRSTARSETLYQWAAELGCPPCFPFWAEVVGLRAASDLNGRVCQVLGPPNEQGRCACELDTGWGSLDAAIAPGLSGWGSTTPTDLTAKARKLVRLANLRVLPDGELLRAVHIRCRGELRMEGSEGPSLTGMMRGMVRGTMRGTAPARCVPVRIPKCHSMVVLMQAWQQRGMPASMARPHRTIPVDIPVDPRMNAGIVTANISVMRQLDRLGWEHEGLGYTTKPSASRFGLFGEVAHYRSPLLAFLGRDVFFQAVKPRREPPSVWRHDAESPLVTMLMDAFAGEPDPPWQEPGSMLAFRTEGDLLAKDLHRAYWFATSLNPNFVDVASRDAFFSTLTPERYEEYLQSGVADQDEI